MEFWFYCKIFVLIFVFFLGYVLEFLEINGELFEIVDYCERSLVRLGNLYLLLFVVFFVGNFYLFLN